MSKLRREMVESMQLHGLAPTTQSTYIRCICSLANYYGHSPRELSEQEVRAFLLHLVNERKLAPGSFGTHLYAIKFLYGVTLGRAMGSLKHVRPQKRRKLPVVLSPGEVRQILRLVRNPAARACLYTMYSCGLRRSEAVALTVHDIDSKRMFVRVRKGKGGKDRYVPLPERLLVMLRNYWAATRPKELLFPVADGRPMCPRYLARLFRSALRQSGVQKHATLHTLRHSYATYLMDNQVSMCAIQQALGHASPKSTAIYTHVTDKSFAQMRQTLDTVLSTL